MKYSYDQTPDFPIPPAVSSALGPPGRYKNKVSTDPPLKVIKNHKNSGRALCLRDNDHDPGRGSEEERSGSDGDINSNDESEDQDTSRTDEESDDEGGKDEHEDEEEETHAKSTRGVRKVRTTHTTRRGPQPSSTSLSCGPGLMIQARTLNHIQVFFMGLVLGVIGGIIIGVGVCGDPGTHAYWNPVSAYKAFRAAEANVLLQFFLPEVSNHAHLAATGMFTAVATLCGFGVHQKKFVRMATSPKPTKSLGDKRRIRNPEKEVESAEDSNREGREKVRTSNKTPLTSQVVQGSGTGPMYKKKKNYIAGYPRTPEPVIRRLFPDSSDARYSEPAATIHNKYAPTKHELVYVVQKEREWPHLRHSTFQGQTPPRLALLG